MKIAIFGLGYVGLTAAACLAKLGHTIVGVDVSQEKVTAVREGRSPIKEPQVEELLQQALGEDRLKALTNVGSELDDCDMAIVCVGTPSAADGSHNMAYIAEVTRQIGKAVKPDRTRPLTLVYRSTIRPGTIEELILPIITTIQGETPVCRTRL